MPKKKVVVEKRKELIPITFTGAFGNELGYQCPECHTVSREPPKSMWWEEHYLKGCWQRNEE